MTGGSLVQAISSGRVETAHELVSRGIMLDERDANGRTPLHLAVRRGDVELVIALLAAGANPENRDRDGYRPLHWAASTGNLDAARVLVEAGVDVNVKGNMVFIIRETRTPLHLAVDGGHLAVVEYLLAAGAQVNEINDTSNDTAMCAATRRDDLHLMHLLAANGASPHGVDVPLPRGGVQAHRNYPLQWVRSRAAVELLVGLGADVNARPIDAPGALAEAVDRTWAHDRFNEDGLDPVVRVERALDAVTALVELGATFADGTYDPPGAVPDAVEALLREAETRAGITERRTPLLGGRPTSAVTLVSRPTDTMTALATACARGRIREAATLCLENPADLNRGDERGRTPLALLLAGGIPADAHPDEYLALVELMLQTGARIDQPDLIGRTPLDVCPPALRNQIEPLTHP